MVDDPELVKDSNAADTGNKAKETLENALRDLCQLEKHEKQPVQHKASTAERMSFTPREDDERETIFAWTELDKNGHWCEERNIVWDSGGQCLQKPERQWSARKHRLISWGRSFHKPFQPVLNLSKKVTKTKKRKYLRSGSVVNQWIMAAPHTCLWNRLTKELSQVSTFHTKWAVSKELCLTSEMMCDFLLLACTCFQLVSFRQG